MPVDFVLGTESPGPVEMETESDPMEETDGTQDISGRALVWDYRPQRPSGQKYMVL